MIEKTIEQKATDLFIARYGLTTEEFAESESYFKNTFGYEQCIVIIRFLEISEAIVNSFKNVWDDLKDLPQKIANIQENIEKKKVLQSKWMVQRDTRIKSQVMANKPKHLVRKIIR